MKELIKVSVNENDEQLVSGRVTRILLVGTPYKRWFERITEYGFAENVDFTVIAKMSMTRQLLVAFVLLLITL